MNFQSHIEINGVETECTVEYDYQPAEDDTNTSEAIDITGIKLADGLELLTVGISPGDFETFVDEAWQDVQNRRERISAMREDHAESLRDR